MISYVVQVGTSRQFRYRSLYEAQVTGRADSAAHAADYLEAALHLLEVRKLPLPDSARHLDLRALLATGVHIDLTDGKQLTMAQVEPASAAVGKTIRDAFAGEHGSIEIAAIFRDEHVLLPQPGTVVCAKDRLLIIGGPGVHERLRPLIEAEN